MPANRHNSKNVFVFIADRFWLKKEFR